MRTPKPTVYLCVRLECEERPMWSLTNGKRHLKACDGHLANALRMLGLPAHVAAFADASDDEPTGRHEIVR